MSEQKHEHGTIKSYVTGFVLSLVFTFIPYYMVVNQILSGTILLIIILGIAVIQMIIQIVFFLHLGRGPKPNWNLYFFGSTIGIILLVVGGSVLIMNHLYLNMSPSDQVKRLINDEGIYQIDGELTGACYGQYDTHKVTIRNGMVDPWHTEAKKCDTIIFINEDEGIRSMTFGTHPDHGIYAGEAELLVRNGRSNSIILSEIGTYQFHDHLQPETTGFFTVEQR